MSVTPKALGNMPVKMLSLQKDPWPLKKSPALLTFPTATLWVPTQLDSTQISETGPGMDMCVYTFVGACVYVHMSTCMYRGQKLTSGVPITFHLILQHLSLNMEIAILAWLTGQPVGQTWKHVLLCLAFTPCWGLGLGFSCLPSKHITCPL